MTVDFFALLRKITWVFSQPALPQSSFSVIGPSFWREFRSNLRLELLRLSVLLFGKRLKTILFHVVRQGGVLLVYLLKCCYMKLRFQIDTRMEVLDSIKQVLFKLQLKEIIYSR